MKNNRKNKKLNFIRIKNSLRLGMNSFFVSRKISNEYLKELPENHIQNFIEYSKKQLKKIYKLDNLNKADYKIDYCGDDFILDLKTERVELKLN